MVDEYIQALFTVIKKQCFLDNFFFKMPMSLKPKFLQYGKDFHVFFFHAFSSNDMAYTLNRIGIIQIYW